VEKTVVLVLVDSFIRTMHHYVDQERLDILEFVGVSGDITLLSTRVTVG